jgi:hypothetical protein
MNPAPAKADCGFVYVATGERYVAEAAASAASLRRHHPHERICLVTDKARGTGFWDDLIVLENPRLGFRDKIEMRRAPYARCIFLDADTAIFGSLAPLFTLLERYDVCGVHLSEGQDYEMPDIPAAFPEMNGGILGFRTGEATADFFARWAHHYDAFHALNRAGDYHYANVGDQKSLRAALWHSQVRHTAIGAEFNFIPFRLELVSLPVVVLHTRVPRGLDALIRRLNAQLGRRTYSPEFDAVIGPATGPRELWRLTLAIGRQWARLVGRAVLPRGVRDWFRRSRHVRRWLFGNPFANPPHPTDTRKWEET